MGGRYGAADDGSSAYQSRRPSSDDREGEQQTVAEAVRAVEHRQQNKSDHAATQDAGTSSGGKYQRSASSSDTHGETRASTIGDAADTIVSSMIDVDEAVADMVAEQLVEQIRRANEEELVDDSYK